MTERNVVWCSPGMRFFGELTAAALGYELNVGGYVGACDTIHIIGMYDAPDYTQTLKMTEGAKRKVIHWCGTDVLLLRDAGALPHAQHVADSEGLVEELFLKGVEAECVMFPTKHHFPVTPLPEQPQVVAYLGSNPATYGNDVFTALAQAMPDVQFKGFMFGQLNAEGMAILCAESTAIVRLTRHDGSGATAREFMEAGRYCVSTNGINYAHRVLPDALPEIVKAVQDAIAHTEPDLEAAAYWAKQNSVERFVAQIGELNA